MTSRNISAAITMSMIVLGRTAFCIEPDAATLRAWDQYVRAASVRTQCVPEANEPFLWIDANGDRKLRIQHGAIEVMPVAAHGARQAPGGLIHDWIGGVFIPRATIHDLLSVLGDYDQYKTIYKPVVTDSRLVSANSADQEFSMTWKRRVMFVTAAMQAVYRVHGVLIDAQRGYSTVDAVRIQQIEDYGRADERLLAPDSGNGFIWRMRSLAKYEERDGGVYLEIEAMALTRSIPPSLEWLVAPVVNRLSSDSLAMTLRETRKAVSNQSALEGH